MILTIYLPDDLYSFFLKYPDSRKAVEAVLAAYVHREREFLKETPYDTEATSNGD